MKFRLIHYFDVWGNKKEGFDVNNLCEQAIFEFPEWPSETQILERLKKIDFLKTTCRLNSMRFDHNYSDAVGINERDGRPLCRVECIDYEIAKHGNPEEYENYHLENGRRIYD